MDIELIPVQVPRGKEFAVFVPSIITHKPPEEVQQELEDKLSVCGVVYDAAIFKNFKYDKKINGEIVYFAFIRFYSTKATLKAIQLSRKLQIDGKKIRICKKTKDDNAYKNFNLPLWKAQNLISNYFGFNSWTSKIVYLEKEKEAETPDLVRFVCLVKLEMVREGIISEGVGVGEVPHLSTSAFTRGSAYMTARRFAHYSAMTAAFSKLIIVKLGNGKMCVEVDTTQTDPLFYDPAWDNPVIKVDQLDMEPQESENCILENLSEEQLDHLLNVTI